MKNATTVSMLVFLVTTLMPSCGGEVMNAGSNQPRDEPDAAPPPSDASTPNARPELARAAWPQGSCPAQCRDLRLNPASSHLEPANGDIVVLPTADDVARAVVGRYRYCDFNQRGPDDSYIEGEEFSADGMRYVLAGPDLHRTDAPPEPWTVRDIDGRGRFQLVRKVTVVKTADGKKDPADAQAPPEVRTYDQTYTSTLLRCPRVLVVDGLSLVAEST